MSFNTSWGSSTRQDHPTFMSGTQPSNSGRSRDTTSFSKQQNTSSSTATISYAIGPSTTTSPTRSPKKLTSTSLGPNASTSFLSSRAGSSFAVEIPFPNEEAAQRHLRLSQKHEALIERAPEPDEKAPKDTSVNIATAFHQATIGPPLSATASMNGKPLSAGSSRSNLRNASSDRLAAPQLPSLRSRPPTGTQEEDTSEGTSARFKRAVSPIIEGAGQVVSAGIRAVSPGIVNASQALMTGASTLVGPSSFALREPRPTQYQSFRVPGEESYDYAQEEALADALPSSQTNGTKGLTKRKSLGKRLNEDNRAYKPPPEVESDSSDGETKGRRKGIVVQRSLITGAPAPSKKRAKRKSSGHAAPSEDGSTTVQRAGSNQSRAGSTIQANSRQGSLQPPQFSREDIEDVEEVEDEIEPPDAMDPDFEEPEFQDDGMDYDEEPSQEHAPTIGARLGKATNALVHLVVQSVGMVLLVVWKTLRSMYELLVERPKAFVAGGWREVKHFSDLVNPKTLGVIFLIGAIWYASFSRPTATSPTPMPSRRGWFDFLPSFRRRPVYVAPEMPVGSVEELIERLHILEGAFVTLQSEHRSSVDEYRKGIQQLESDSRQSDGSFTGRLMAIENRLEGESRRAISAGETDRQATRKSVKSLEDLISGVRNEVSALHVAIAQQAKADRTVDPRADERIGALEKEMRDVYERLKTITVTDKKGQNRPISVDGKDIAKVVQEIMSKDGVAMADYALYYSGGAIEPRTTSKTLAIRPGSWVGKDVRGRPPVTALVPDNSVGNCWPFAGSKAQLGIRLSRVVQLTHITIDHPARELLIDPESAPRQFHLWVAVEGHDNIQRAEIFNSQQDEKRHASSSEVPHKPFGPWNLLHVGTFEYNIKDSTTAQTFALPAEYQALGLDTGAIVVDFGSNWGADHTCVYRVRAHGARVGAP